MIMHSQTSATASPWAQSVSCSSMTQATHLLSRHPNRQKRSCTTQAPSHKPAAKNKFDSHLTMMRISRWCGRGFECRDSPSFLEAHPPLARFCRPRSHLSRWLSIRPHLLFRRIKPITQSHRQLLPRLIQVAPQRIYPNPRIKYPPGSRVNR